MTLSLNDLKFIERVTNNATPGPWYTPEECDKGKDIFPPLDHEDCDVWPWDKKEDMIFAYKARSFVPELIKEIKRLRKID